MTRPLLRRLFRAGLVLGAFSLCFGVVAGARAQTELLNVSYDPTRELYREINAAFVADWNAKNAKKIDDPPVAWRLRRAGAHRHRRARLPMC